MTIDEATYGRMPPHLQALFVKLRTPGSDEVMEAFAAFGNRGGGDKRGQLDGRRPGGFANVGSPNGDGVPCATVYGDSGSAARFFYCAKASKAERGAGNAHPTVKPLALMRWLVKLVCPEGGLILDPFGGSGTTALAALAEGRRCLVIEKDEAYYEIARKRVAQALEART